MSEATTRGLRSSRQRVAGGMLLRPTDFKPGGFKPRTLNVNVVSCWGRRPCLYAMRTTGEAWCPEGTHWTNLAQRYRSARVEERSQPVLTIFITILHESHNRLLTFLIGLGSISETDCADLAKIHTLVYISLQTMLREGLADVSRLPNRPVVW